MPPSRPRTILRKLAGLAGISLAAVVGSFLFAGAASAHEPAFTATTNCSGVVHFRAEAWAGDAGAPLSDADRTHEDMAVKVSDDSGPWHDLPGTYAFNRADGFAFSGDYTPPTGWASIRIQTFSRSFAEASSPVLTVTATTGCTPPAVPMANVAAATCDQQSGSGSSLVTLQNTGGSPATFTVSVPGQPDVVVTVPAGGTASRTIAVPVGDTPISVAAPGMATVTRTVNGDCTTPPGELRTASVADATCSAGGSVVTLTNSGLNPADFTIHVPGSPDRTVTVPPGGTSTQPVTLPAGTTTAITVSSSGMGDVTKAVTYTCASTPPGDTPVVPSTPEQPVFVAPEVVTPIAVPVVEVPVAAPATAEVTPPAPAPEAQVLGEEATVGAPAATAPSSATLPFTGAETGPLALTAFGSLLAGLAMVFAGRRRTAQQ